MKKWHWGVGMVVILAIAAVVVLLWPAPDPLQGVETVALRIGDQPDNPTLDLESELLVVLGDRNIRILTDEAEADAVLEVTDFVLNLGDIELSLRDGAFRGKARALCKLSNVRTGSVHVMDFTVTIENGIVRAELTARKFWQFWKDRPAQGA